MNTHPVTHPVQVRPAGEQDLASWMELVREVEPLFGPMPTFEEPARRGIERGTALVAVAGDRVDGAVLLSRDDRPHEIHWLSVRETARRRGVGALLMRAVLDRWPTGAIEVTSFAPGLPEGQPARHYYEHFGFIDLGPTTPAPDGGARHRFGLQRHKLLSAPIQTPRLTLRRSRPGDAAVFHQLWTERDERVPAHRRLDEVGHPDVAEITASLDERAARDARTGLGLLTVVTRANSEVIGYCGLIESDYSTGAPEPELAYELLAAQHGHGYATEAARAVLHATRDAGWEHVWASVRDWNSASFRVLAKLGFERSGMVESDPEHGDSVLMVLNRVG